MADYIDREMLFKNLNKFALEEYNALVNRLITEQPTVDVAPVIHSKWKEADWVKLDPSGLGVKITPKAAWRCSNCHSCFKKKWLWRSTYCPNCGAKMDG